MKTQLAIALFTASLLGARAEADSETTSALPDPYLPKVRFTETNVFAKGSIAYRFAPDQLARMAHTRLETNRFIVFIRKQWPVNRLASYCIPKNRFPESYQNLVADNCVVETDVYGRGVGGFDRIWVYANQDDGHRTYIGEAGTRWRRWSYSLNVQKGAAHWVLIGQLPNDFMDSIKYGSAEPDGSASRGQPVGPATNRPAAAAGSGR